MDDAKLSSLRTYYDSLSDEALLGEAKLGRDAFAAEAWAIISQQIDQRGLRSGHTHRHHGEPHHDAPVAKPGKKQPTLAERLGARIDALPPNIKPVAFGATLVLMFALTRWQLMPIFLIWMFATSPHPWASLLTGIGVFLLAMAGGALSGLAYTLVGRRLRTAFRGGYFLTGIVTLAPYMLVLVYIVRFIEDHVPLWHRPQRQDVVLTAVVSLFFGILLGRSWFGAEEKAQRAERAT